MMERDLTNEEAKAIQILKESFSKHSVSSPGSESYDRVDFPPFEKLWADENPTPIFIHSSPKQKKEFGNPNSFAVKILSIAAGIALVFLGAWFGWKDRVFPNYQAKITQVHGGVFALNSDESPRVHLNQLESVSSGEMISVDSDGYVDLSLTPTSSIRLQANSRAILESIHQEDGNERIRIYLKNGAVLAHVAKLKKTSEFVIRTDWGDVHVRGTQFLTQSTNEGILVGVASGRVEFQSSATLQATDSRTYSDENLDRQGNFPNYPIEVLPGFQVESDGNLSMQKPISISNKKKLAELDYLKLEDIDLSDTQKFIESEEDLFNLYSILEVVHLEDGKSHRGVIYGMNDTYLYMRTVEGEVKILQKEILDVEKIR